MKLINIGYNNMVLAGRVIAMVDSDSAPIKRIIQEAKENHRLIDATSGRKTRTVIIMDSDHVVLSAVQRETMAKRLEEPGDTLDTPETEEAEAPEDE
ncbi:MAG: DUF370 domain-containing protein [Oscillospiraceae bacterium]|nr:DUF370 domain-containing protein [Oscillospiraceae bacterium]